MFYAFSGVHRIPDNPDASIDRIWSFDVFVHIQAIDIEAYVAQFARILRPGGTALIHHSKSGTFARGWRSDMIPSRAERRQVDPPVRCSSRPGGRCFAVSGSHSRCTVPSAASHTTLTISQRGLSLPACTRNPLRRACAGEFLRHARQSPIAQDRVLSNS